ncbi:hypothetical protein EXIGLDRAFT_764097 [Exidia glandulosa HHB12029]|uniref:F-box domain-containing protein n=1 Tax=Exidia glandulosa HHB12029 TaxID=1314781 RepID=A0A165LDV5_EXIGL|nr:hypothetical protein EXIGLDRAFT_764097 [Exidia glandulosa HHB12029]
MPSTTQEVKKTAGNGSNSIQIPPTPHPFPLLNEIVLLIAEAVEPNVAQTIKLAQISKQWRQVVVHSSVLWRRLTGLTPAGTQSLGTLLLRTGIQRFTIELQLGKVWCWPLQNLRSYLSRVQSLTITYDDPKPHNRYLSEFIFTLSVNLDRLEKLRYFARSPEKLPFWAMKAPNMRSVTMHISQMRHLRQNSRPQVTEFCSVTPPPGDDDYQHHCLVYLHKAAPNLVTLTLDAIPHDARSPPHFAALRNLQLHSRPADNRNGLVRSMLQGLGAASFTLVVYKPYLKSFIVDGADLPRPEMITVTRNQVSGQLELIIHAAQPVPATHHLFNCNPHSVSALFTISTISERFKDVGLLGLSLSFERPDKEFLSRIALPALTKLVLIVPFDPTLANDIERIHTLRDDALSHSAFPALSTVSLRRAPQSSATVHAEHVLAFLRRRAEAVEGSRLVIELQVGIEVSGSADALEQLRERSSFTGCVPNCLEPPSA